jgi:hypothetical protein
MDKICAKQLDTLLYFESKGNNEGGMRKLLKKKGGQVLAISIIAMFVLFIFGLAIVETGNLIYEKIHMQNIADSSAMEAGTWYARSLNMVSLSNKMLVVTTGVALAATLYTAGTTWPFWNDILKVMVTAQDIFAGTGDAGKAQLMPWLCWGSVLLNGKRNDSLSLAVFNVETFKENKLPTFNLKRRTLSDMLDEEQLQTKYYYVTETSGKKVNVPKGEVKKNIAGRLYQNETGKFVIKEQGVAGDAVPEDIRKIMKTITGAVKELDEISGLDKMPFDVVETGPHTVLVVSFKDKVKQKLGTNFFIGDDGKKIEPFLAASALVRVDGGSLYFWEMDGASYSPHLDKVQMPVFADFTSVESREIMEQAGKYVRNMETGDFSGAFSYLDKAGKVLTSGMILH